MLVSVGGCLPRAKSTMRKFILYHTIKVLKKHLTKKGVISLLRGFYTAASGMIAQQRHQESVSNNIAYTNKPGYMAEKATLRSLNDIHIQNIGNKYVTFTNNM